MKMSQVTEFKIRLTEGRTPAQAVARLTHPLRRMGFVLAGRARTPR